MAAGCVTDCLVVLMEVLGPALGDTGKSAGLVVEIGGSGQLDSMTPEVPVNLRSYWAYLCGYSSCPDAHGGRS